MKIKTKVLQHVKVWIEQEVTVEVDSIEEFEQQKKKHRLDRIATDWDNYNIKWDTIRYIDEDNSESKIEKIIEE